ncbi:MAG: LysR family transcriptional regulator [Gemmatimonadetes bacterium]|nr:LysR family transcriptional regulator [Gemmatimonadota bacterium]
MILETRHLQLVAAIAQHGTMTRSARDLNLSQSALSHMLGNLERRLGTPLFRRLGKRMTLTVAGERVLLAAQRTLEELRAAEDDLTNVVRGEVDRLKIATECYTTYHWLPRVMHDFERTHAGVELRIVAEATSDPLAALAEGSVDVAIMMNRHAGRHLRAWPLFRDELVVVTAPDHPFAERGHVELGDLCGEHLLVYSSLSAGSSFLGQLLREAGLAPRRVSQIMLTEATLELVAGGVGVSVLARWAVQPAIATGRVVPVKLTRAGVHRQWFAVALRHARPRAAVRALVDMLATGPSVLEIVPGGPPTRRAPGRRGKLARSA